MRSKLKLEGLEGFFSSCHILQEGSRTVEAIYGPGAGFLGVAYGMSKPRVDRSPWKRKRKVELIPGSPEALVASRVDTQGVLQPLLRRVR